MSLKQQALRGVVWSVSDKLINSLGFIAVSIYLAKLIGPESFGLIGMLTIFILLSESVVNIGFSQALVQRSDNLTEEDSCTVFYINLVWGVLIYLILYALAPLIAMFFREPILVDISRVLFLVVIINSLSVVVRAKLIIKIDFKSQAIAGTFSTVLSSAIAITLALFGYGYWALVFLTVTKAVFLLFALLFFCRWWPQLIFSMTSFKSLFKFGSNLMLAGLVATLVSNLYTILIGRFYNATQVGYFSQAVNLSNYLNQFVSSSLQGVTYPIMTSIKDDRERLINIYKQVISISLLVSLPILIGFAAIADEFVIFFLGSVWEPSIPVLVAMCISRSITPISLINMNILNAIGRSDLFLKVDLVKLPMTVAAIFIALPYGIEAIAWAVVATSFISFFINAFYPGKLFSFGSFEQIKVSYKYFIAAAVMYLIVQPMVLDSLLLTIVTKVSVGVVVYVIMLIVLKDSFSKTFIRKLLTK